MFVACASTPLLALTMVLVSIGSAYRRGRRQDCRCHPLVGWQVAGAYKWLGGKIVDYYRWLGGKVVQGAKAVKTWFKGRGSVLITQCAERGTTFARRAAGHHHSHWFAIGQQR